MNYTNLKVGATIFFVRIDHTAHELVSSVLYTSFKKEDCKKVFDSFVSNTSNEVDIYLVKATKLSASKTHEEILEKEYGHLTVSFI